MPSVLPVEIGWAQPQRGVFGGVWFFKPSSHQVRVDSMRFRVELLACPMGSTGTKEPTVVSAIFRARRAGTKSDGCGDSWRLSVRSFPLVHASMSGRAHARGPSELEGVSQGYLAKA